MKDIVKTKKVVNLISRLKLNYLKISMIGVSEEIFSLNWGKITPEFYNESENISVHVFNHLSQRDDLVEINIKFMTGRLKWFSRNLPDDCKQIVKIDDRGQGISEETMKRIVESLGSLCETVEFLSQGE